MNGLGRYELIPVKAELKAKLERIIQDAQNLGAGEYELCGRCLRRTHRLPGFACRDCCPHNPGWIVTGYMIKNNGVRAAQRVCLGCGDRTDISRGETRQIHDLCFRDNTKLFQVRPCTRCGSASGTELHHWAPRAIFNDAELWPTSWLCPGCHRTWHQAIRAAGGHRLPEDQRIGEPPSYMQILNATRECGT